MFGCVLGEKGSFLDRLPAESKTSVFRGVPMVDNIPGIACIIPHPWRTLMQMMLVMRGMLFPRLGQSRRKREKWVFGCPRFVVVTSVLP